MKPTHTILHISDTHFVEEGESLRGAVDCDLHLQRVFDRLHSSQIRPDALVFTGDLADDGQENAYSRLKALVEPVAESYGAEILWVMGNHDSRPEFREGLLGSPKTEEPVDYTVELNGLRLIVLDSTVPGHHHGEINDEQYEWLAAQLATTAEHGTLLALHHPPVPTPLVPLELVELRERDALAEALRGSDVRGILAGHLHYSSSSTVPGGIPLSVAGATCYTHDPKVLKNRVQGVNGAQSFNLVEVYRDRVVHTVLPLLEHPVIVDMTVESMEELLRESERNYPLHAG